MIKLINIKYIIIFSILIELIALFFIRLIGIDWDYHVDSVTYITFSEAVTEKVLKSKLFPLSLLNQGFYILVDFLDSSPNNIISFNILIFAITNHFIALCLRPFRHKYYILFEYLILFNPYRVYLGTAILKDNFVIFLLVIGFYFWQYKIYPKILKLDHDNISKTFKSLFLLRIIISITAFIILIITRIASVIYLLMIPRKLDDLRSKSSLLIILFVILIINNYFDGNIINTFTNAGNTNMNFREYGNVPNFSNLGELGTILRTIFWPILFTSGSFIIFTPSPEMILIATGTSLVFFIQIKLKNNHFLTNSFLNYFFFAGITSGFLSFARYSMPIWLLSSIIIYIKSSPKYNKLSEEQSHTQNIII